MTPGDPASCVHARELQQPVFDLPHPGAEYAAWPETAEALAF